MGRRGPDQGERHGEQQRQEQAHRGRRPGPSPGVVRHDVVHRDPLRSSTPGPPPGDRLLEGYDARTPASVPPARRGRVYRP
ncbi:hypothetical protein GCM10009737_02190 [Nocardioides lentus]|uniref:Uncharacterized protein n=1 Tax=Nocardioides lentus TaxID=338077 RepID=A0ABN2NW46_9ACTN